jgi:Short C-terminal domain
MTVQQQSKIVRRRGVTRAVVIAGRTRAAQADTASSPAGKSAPPTWGMLEQLEQLAELLESGVLTEDEFAGEKRKLLGA